MPRMTSIDQEGSHIENFFTALHVSTGRAAACSIRLRQLAGADAT